MFPAGVHGEQRQPRLAAAHHDEGPVRQLRRPEDDRCGGDQSTEDPDAQDSTSLFYFKKIHLR